MQDALGADDVLRHWNDQSRTTVADEYLGAENRILRGQIKGRPLLSEGEKTTL